MADHTQTELAAPTQYRKKPVVIEAVQFTQAVRDAHLFDKQPLPEGVIAGGRHLHPGRREVYSAAFFIETLEGRMEVSLDDWIITGVKGERYPCKPDIFAATYESAADTGVDGLPMPTAAIAPNGRMVKWDDNYLTEPWLSHGYTPLYTAEQVRQAQRDTDREARQRVAVALGLGRSMRASFAWEYLLGIIEECAKEPSDAELASRGAAQERTSIDTPEFREMLRDYRGTIGLLIAAHQMNEIIAHIDAWGARRAVPEVSMPRYKCKGKGGEYELIGVAYGAGTSRGTTMNLYKEVSTGVKYYRTPADFHDRMELIAAAPVPGKEE